MAIADKLEKETVLDDAAIAWLNKKIAFYVASVNRDLVLSLADADHSGATETKTQRYFRKRERVENIDRILQYLQAFLKRLPGAEELGQGALSPFAQFRQLVEFEINLLQEEDVVKGVLRESLDLGILKAANVWYYEGLIRDKQQAMARLIARASIPSPGALFLLFGALKRWCLFWFDVRREDVRRVRKSNVFVFKLVRLLELKHGRTAG